MWCLEMGTVTYSVPEVRLEVWRCPETRSSSNTRGVPRVYTYQDTTTGGIHGVVSMTPSSRCLTILDSWYEEMWVLHHIQYQRYDYVEVSVDPQQGYIQW